MNKKIVKYKYYKDYLDYDWYKKHFQKGEYNKENKTIEIIFNDDPVLNEVTKYTDNPYLICKIAEFLNNPADFDINFKKVIDTIGNFNIFNEKQRKQAENHFIERLDNFQVISISMVTSHVDYDDDTEKERIVSLARQIRKEQREKEREGK